MRLLWGVLLCLLVMSGTSCWAASPFEQMKTSGTGGISVVGDGDEAATVMTLSPTIGLGNFSAGLDINIFMPAKNKPSDVPVIGVRYLEYDDGISGIRYGVLSGITLGYGLIMDGYSTYTGGSTMFDPGQAGVKVYTRMFEPFYMMVMGTNSRVYAQRLTYSPDFLKLFDIPVVLGESYAIDLDGVRSASGVIGEEQSAGAVDVAWPVFGSLGTVFAEAAQLSNYSKGVMSGLTGKVFDFLDYRIDYRQFGGQFVPGYFNYQYETSPIDLTTINRGKITGYHAGLGLNLGSIAYFQADYENYTYEDTDDVDPRLIAQLFFNGIDGIDGYARYEQLNMRSLDSIDDQGANVIAEVFVPPAKFGYNYPGKMKIKYKGYYDVNGDYQESQEFGYVFSF